MTDHLSRYAHWHEYDLAFVRGRVVNAYDPVRHCWRPRLVYTLGLSYVPPADPDEAMTPEPDTLDPPSPDGVVPGWKAAQLVMRARSDEGRQRIVDVLRAAGKPLSRAQIAKRLDTNRYWVENHLPHTPGVVFVGYAPNRAKLFTVEEE